MKEIGYLIKSVADKLKQNTEKELKKYDLTLSQSRVLLYLDSRGGETLQKELQEYFQVTHTTIIGIIARLENKGFVKTWINLKNKKERVVGLTERAVFVVEDMERARNEREQLLKVDMTDQEVEDFIRVLERMQRNINVSEEAESKGAIKKAVEKEEAKESILWFL